MRRAFLIVGPTATGQSEIAEDVAWETYAEIVRADALRTHPGLDLLTMIKARRCSSRSK